jgi:hypothetical protein
MGQLRILDETGDTKLIWDKQKPDEIEAAEEMFDKLKDKGYKAFRVDDKGDKSGEMKKFDSKAEKIIMVPPMQAG